MTKDPLRTDFSSVEASFEIDVDDSVYGKYVADAQGDATFTFDNGGASGAEREMGLTFQNAYLAECTDPVNSAGLISMSLKFICESDGTDHGLKIIMKNQAADAEVMST